MFVTTVMVKVKPEHVDAFIKASIINHESSVQEPGNMRFDLLQCADDPASFMLYEAYDSAASSAAHKQTAHYAAWRDAVAPFMAEPRQGIPYNGIRP
ncbi:MAG: antibiotic biosynthesis monooxygenase [Chitinispirillaceae bacterium]|nr:antibiotic biosynthesis monooxygenase [Chitinispirillaceae bacterium]